MPLGVRLTKDLWPFHANKMNNVKVRKFQSKFFN